jgi:hypothetical protein
MGEKGRAEELIQHSTVKSLHKSVVLRSPHTCTPVLDVNEVQILLVGVTDAVTVTFRDLGVEFPPVEEAMPNNTR